VYGDPNIEANLRPLLKMILALKKDFPNFAEELDDHDRTFKV